MEQHSHSQKRVTKNRTAAMRRELARLEALLQDAERLGLISPSDDGDAIEAKLNAVLSQAVPS